MHRMHPATYKIGTVDEYIMIMKNIDMRTEYLFSIWKTEPK